MREAFEEDERGLRIAGRNITNLRYADDTTLLAENEEDLVQLLRKVKARSEQAGLFLHLGKTKVLSNTEMQDFNLDGEAIEVVEAYKFLGATINRNGTCEEEISTRIGKGKAAMLGLSKLWKDRSITLQTKKKLVETLVFPVVLHGSEPGVLKKKERKKIYSFKLWCWRRMLRISWKERKTNKWVLEQVKPSVSLESMLVLLTLRYVGHDMEPMARWRRIYCVE